MSTKAKLIVGYLAIALLAAIYGSIWGDNAHRSFAYNLGAGLLWPIMLFPGLGKIIGALILVMFIGLVMAS